MHEGKIPTEKNIHEIRIKSHKCCHVIWFHLTIRACISLSVVFFNFVCVLKSVSLGEMYNDVMLMLLGMPPAPFYRTVEFYLSNVRKT